MQQLENGWWVPDGAYGKAFFAEGAGSLVSAPLGSCLRRCPHRLLAIDGGGYVGLWARLMKQHFARVIAFEPVPENYECLKKNVGAMGVECRPEALSSTCDDLVLYPSHRAYGWSAKIVKAAELTPISVPAVTIDSLMLPACDLIKLDLEGHELAALQGAADTISKFRPVVLIEEKFDRERKACHFLKSLGMKLKERWKHDFMFVWPKVRYVNGVTPDTEHIQ